MCVFLVLCVVRQKSLRWTAPSFRGVLATVMCHSAWGRNLKHELALALGGLLHQWEGGIEFHLITCHKLTAGLLVELYSFFIPRARRVWVVTAMPRPLYLRERNSVPFIQEARWPPGPFRTCPEILTPVYCNVRVDWMEFPCSGKGKSDGNINKCLGISSIR